MFSRPRFLLKRVSVRVLLPPLLAFVSVLAVACAPGVPIQAPPTNPPSTPTFSQRSSVSVDLSGNSGRVETFTLTAGTYVIDQTARYDPAGDPSGSGECVFAGELDNLTTGTSAALGGGSSPILPSTPLGKAVTGTLNAGTFKLEIYPPTTCDWDVTIVKNAG